MIALGIDRKAAALAAFVRVYVSHYLPTEEESAVLDTPEVREYIETTEVFAAYRLEENSKRARRGEEAV